MNAIAATTTTAPPASFFEQVRQQTAAGRAFVEQAPIVQAALAGTLSRERYLAFLAQAWHHVRETVPLLMAVGARLPDHHRELRNQVLHYLEEENGHDDWILADIAAAGGDAGAVAASRPNPETDAMVACAWDTVLRRNPVGFFGMVFVLEGTSAALALKAAATIRQSLGLPAGAFTYLTSHGHLDQEHVQHLAGILDSLTRPEDRAAVLQCARTQYWLYGEVFRGVDRHLPGAAALTGGRS